MNKRKIILRKKINKVIIDYLKEKIKKLYPKNRQEDQKLFLMVSKIAKAGTKK